MYQVLFAIHCDDGLSLAPGEHSLAEVDAELLAAWLHNGWVVGAAPAAPAAPEVEAPAALPHFYGEGEAPVGTWEHQQHDAPRKRGRKSEE